MNELPHTLYHRAAIRELDRRASEAFGIPAATLMERAGHACVTALLQRWPRAQRIVVLCGAGNNGGDGYIIARLLKEKGRSAKVIRLEPSLQGEALAAAQRAAAAGVEVESFNGHSLAGFDLIVDALLGIGLRGEPAEVAVQAINACNTSGRPVLAVDIPSGVDADTGHVASVAVRAEVTVTFIGLKFGLFTGEGGEHSGRVIFDSLGVSDGAHVGLPPVATRLDASCAASYLAPRPRAAHKGDFGHVLVVGGEQGMAGAVRLAGEAAARVGAGLVTIATRAVHAALLSVGRPELMVHGVEAPEALIPLLQRASVVAIGPGLGTGEWGQAMLGGILRSAHPLVVDADALNLLARTSVQRDNWVLTPHPGEAARLLQTSAAEIQADRLAALQALEQRFGAVGVLKGNGSLISGTPPALCSAGNPGMASGGMGDVLTGVIAGLLAQGLSTSEAARLGVCLHAGAADQAALAGERGLLALDLMPALRRLANPKSTPDGGPEHA